MMFSRKAVYALVLPLMVEQLLGVTIGMADTVMVSSCGEAAVSGVSLVDSINNLCGDGDGRCDCVCAVFGPPEP